MHFISHQKRLSTCQSRGRGRGSGAGQFYVQVLKYSIKSALDGKSPQCAGQEVVKVEEERCPLRSGKSTEFCCLSSLFQCAQHKQLVKVGTAYYCLRLWGRTIKMSSFGQGVRVVGEGRGCCWVGGWPEGTRNSFKSCASFYWQSQFPILGWRIYYLTPRISRGRAQEGCDLQRENLSGK